MADPFDVTTPTQRRLLLATLAVYVVLFAVQLATGNRYATAGADLVLAALVIPVSVFAICRATDRPDTDRVAAATGLALLVAGLTIGYEGLATLGVVSANAVISISGTISLLLAFALYLYQRGQA